MQNVGTKNGGVQSEEIRMKQKCNPSLRVASTVDFGDWTTFFVFCYSLYVTILQHLNSTSAHSKRSDLKGPRSNGGLKGLA